MGTFRVTIEVGAPTGSQFGEISVLVDTGASHSQVPTSLLRDLGVTPHTRRTFALADGRRIQREVGFTWARVNGYSTITTFVFGDESAEPALGAVTLEELGLAVDPLNQRLIPVEGLLMPLLAIS